VALSIQVLVGGGGFGGGFVSKRRGEKKSGKGFPACKLEDSGFGAFKGAKVFCQRLLNWSVSIREDGYCVGGEGVLYRSGKKRGVCH